MGHSDVSLTLTAEPYNWAHVEFPYPASAYFFGHDTSWLSNMYWWSVSDRHSDTIYWMDGWLPTMSVPPELRSLDPAWTSCAPILAGIHDPPTVITAVTTAFGPTLPTLKPTTTPAAPADSPKPKPKSTPVPQPIAPTPSPNQSKSNSATAAQPQASPNHPTTKSIAVNSPAASNSGDNGGTIVLPLDGSSITASKTVVTSGNGVQTTQIIVAGHTMVQGGSAVTLSSHNVSLATNGVVIDGHQTLPVPDGPQRPTTTLTLNGSPVPVMPIDGTAQDGQASSQAIVDGSTLTVGGPAITIGTQVVSLAPGGLVIDGSSIYDLDSSLHTPNVVASATITLPSAQITASEALVTDAQGVIHTVAAIGSRILQPGGTPIIIAGHTVSVGSSAMIVDGIETIPLTAPTSETLSQAVLDLGSTTLSVVEHTSADVEGHSITEAVVAGTTLTPGAAAIIDGHVIAFESGHVVIDGRTTQSFESGATSLPQAIATLPSAEIFASEVITTDSSGQISTLAIIDGTTLDPGAVATVDGHVIRFRSGQLTVDGTQTIVFTLLASAFPSVATLSLNPSLTLSAFETEVTGSDGHTTEEAIIGSETLFAGGPPITLDGEVISLASDGSIVVNGTETIQFSPARNSASTSFTSGQINNVIEATSSSIRPAATATSAGSVIRRLSGSFWLTGGFTISVLIML
ncbi:hypothetical protein HII31_03808 [Pseudocercospora fuligena]|uniref:Uncharacterized protein n=1 Tax=Pseudocercospora fuligena TaxID=685502 RepID=A0A8H6VJK4_9PEZI|nr:hypothetical protein HII31_03808 [Pseudocercospora fuligena]